MYLLFIVVHLVLVDNKVLWGINELHWYGNVKKIAVILPETL